MNLRYHVFFILVSSVACTVGSIDEETSSVDQAVTGGTAIGSWDGTTSFAYGGRCQNVFATSLTSAGYTQTAGSVLTDTCGFQCVELALRYFHYRKGIAASGWHIGTAIEMCNARPAGVSQTPSPVVGDLVVLKANNPAIGTGSAGHVAVVTSLSGDSVGTFNENWANDTTAFASISRGRDVACFLHAGAAPPPSGSQCTSQEIVNATFSGHHFWTCQGANRYMCDERGNKITQGCSGGCVGMGVGADDQCGAPTGAMCTSTEQFNVTFSGGHFWTCQGASRYICDDHTNKVAQSCAGGCAGMGVGHDDQCN
jgi:hypothetical protein